MTTSIIKMICAKSQLSVKDNTIVRKKDQYPFFPNLMSFALFETDLFMLSGQMECTQGEGEAIGLSDWKLA